MAKAVHPQNACRDDMPRGQFRPWTAAGRPAARRRSPTRRIGANRQISETGLRPRQDCPTAGRARATFPALSGIPIRTALSGSRPAASRNKGWLPEPDLQLWPPTAAALRHRAARSHACARPRTRHGGRAFCAGPVGADAKDRHGAPGVRMPSRPTDSHAGHAHWPRAGIRL